GTNLLADNAPFPPDCDKAGPVQCETGTGGARGQSTPTSAGGGGGGGDGGGGNAAAAASGGSDPNGTASATGDTVCDADTGECTSAGGSATGNGSTGQARALPQTIAATSGWGATQTLMLLAVLLTLGLVLAPGLTSRYLESRKPK